MCMGVFDNGSDELIVFIATVCSLLLMSHRFSCKLFASILLSNTHLTYEDDAIVVVTVANKCLLNVFIGLMIELTFLLRNILIKHSVTYCCYTSCIGLARILVRSNTYALCYFCLFMMYILFVSQFVHNIVIASPFTHVSMRCVHILLEL